MRQDAHQETEPCSEHPFASVVVCSRGNRPIEGCIEALVPQLCTLSETLVVLNGRWDPAFADNLARYPVRVLHEPRTGMCIARNRAIRESRGEIVTFLDDDVIAEPRWLHRLLEGFQNPAIACVTGRVIPDGPAYMNTDRYFAERALTRWTLSSADPGWYEEAFRSDTGFGCNMAFRKTFLEQYALCPEDLGAGTWIGAGDEHYLFLEVLKHGFTIAHEPEAIVTHIFSRDLALRKERLKQLYAGSVALHLKFLVEGKGYRWRTLRKLFHSALKQTGQSLGDALGKEPRDVLSPMDKMCAYWKGLLVFRRHMLAKRSANVASR